MALPRADPGEAGARGRGRARWAAGGGHRGRAGPPGAAVRALAGDRGAGRAGRHRPRPRRARPPHPRPARPLPGPRRRGPHGVPGRRGGRAAGGARRRRAGDRGRCRAARSGAGAWTGSSTSATCWPGGSPPTGSVLVHDELGHHAATSVAELLAGRGCAVAISTPAMVVAQQLGTTLDMEMFHRRAHRAGIALATDRVVLSATARPGGVAVRVLEHTTGAVAEVEHDWVVAAVPAEPRDALWPAVARPARSRRPPRRRLPGAPAGRGRRPRRPPGRARAVTRATIVWSELGDRPGTPFVAAGPPASAG